MTAASRISAPAQCAHVGICFYLREFITEVLLVVHVVGYRCESNRLGMGGGVLDKMRAVDASFVFGFCAVRNCEDGSPHVFSVCTEEVATCFVNQLMSCL